MQSPPPPPPANLPITTYEGYSYVAIAGGNTRVSSLAAAQDLCKTLGSDAKVFTWDTAAELKAIGDALKAVRDKGNTGLMNNIWTGFKNTPGTVFFAYLQDPGKTPLRGDGCDVQFGSAQRCLMPWWSDPFGVYEQIVVLNPVGVEQWGTKWTYSLLNLGGSSSAVLCKQLL
ncbi:hypothetical protein COHA_010825, partial [Chlorella ohadii]